MVSPVDTLDEIVGGSGGTWDGYVDSDPPPVRAFVQSKRGALFSIRGVPDTLRGSLNVFVASKNTSKKPTLRWGIYDVNASLLSHGTVEASTIVSEVDPPIMDPGSNDVRINRIAPNPASGSVTVNYTLGASQDAHLELLDMLGRSIGVMADGFQLRGEHEVSYDLRDIPEGSYILRLTTRFGSASAVVKVIH
jgi:hypothetical protein